MYVCVFMCLCVPKRPFQRYAHPITFSLDIVLPLTLTFTTTFKMSSAAARANKATMLELKLRRLMEHNHRLREELARPRVMVSIASLK
jgi:hypothetical protein